MHPCSESTCMLSKLTLCPAPLLVLAKLQAAIVTNDFLGRADTIDCNVGGAGGRIRQQEQTIEDRKKRQKMKQGLRRDLEHWNKIIKKRLKRERVHLNVAGMVLKSCAAPLIYHPVTHLVAPPNASPVSLLLIAQSLRTANRPSCAK